MPRPRIAVVGGDDRGGLTSWPKGYDVRHFPTHDRNPNKLKAALASGRYALVILMTKWIEHHWDTEYVVKRHYWSGSFMELSKNLSTILPPGEDDEEAAAEDWIEKFNREQEDAMEPEKQPAVVMPISVPGPRPKMKFDDAMRVVQRELELFADGLLEDAEVLVVFERVLTRGVER